MISICIPTHNYDVVELVKSLLLQSNIESIPIEIIVADDASSDDFVRKQNRTIGHLPKVKLIESEVNIGRSAIRNFMADEAIYNHLIFIDADSTIPSDYLVKYRQCINEAITVGGTTYVSVCDNKNYQLRWLYGIKREKKDAASRIQNPYSNFTANNFAINKSVFLSIRFAENLKQYGHEDTLFGHEIKKRQIPICHINNAVTHTGLELASVFIDKTILAVENLYQLYIINKDDLFFIEGNKLLMAFKMLEKYKLKRLISFIFKPLKPFFYSNLTSNHPKIWVLDLLKLAHLLKLSESRK